MRHSIARYALAAAFAGVWAMPVTGFSADEPEEDNFGELYLSVLTEKQRLGEERAAYEKQIKALKEQTERLKAAGGGSAAPAPAADTSVYESKIREMDNVNAALRNEVRRLQEDVQASAAALQNVKMAQAEAGASTGSSDKKWRAEVDGKNKKIAELEKRLRSAAESEDELKDRFEKLSEALNKKNKELAGINPADIQARMFADQKAISELQNNVMLEVAKRSQFEKLAQQLDQDNTQIRQQMDAMLKTQEELKARDTEKLLGVVESANHKVQELSQENAITHYNLGVMYMRQAQYVPAAQEFKLAISSNPTNASAHYNLAVLYDAYLNNSFEAIPHYEAYVKLLPDAADAQQIEYRLFQVRLQQDKGIGKDLSVPN